LGIKKGQTTAYHPQSNGATERFNRTLKNTLKMWSNKNQDNWDELLPFALFAYNTGYHSVLKTQPFYLQYGREPRLPIDIVLDRQPQYYPGAEPYAQELLTRLYQAHHDITKIWNDINTEREEAINNATHQPSYKVNDTVWLFDPTTQKGHSRKLTKRWVGPHKILEKRGDVNYLINRNGKQQWVSVHRLKPHKPQELINSENSSQELERAIAMLDASNRAVQEILLKRKEIRADIDSLQAKAVIEKIERDRSQQQHGDSQNDSQPENVTATIVLDIPSFI
jgi:hypothetical protein